MFLFDGLVSLLFELTSFALPLSDSVTRSRSPAIQKLLILFLVVDFDIRSSHIGNRKEGADQGLMTFPMTNLRCLRAHEKKTGLEPDRLETVLTPTPGNYKMLVLLLNWSLRSFSSKSRIITLAWIYLV